MKAKTQNIQSLFIVLGLALSLSACGGKKGALGPVKPNEPATVNSDEKLQAGYSAADYEADRANLIQILQAKDVFAGVFGENGPAVLEAPDFDSEKFSNNLDQAFVDVRLLDPERKLSRESIRAAAVEALKFRRTAVRAYLEKYAGKSVTDMASSDFDLEFFRLRKLDRVFSDESHEVESALSAWVKIPAPEGEKQNLAEQCRGADYLSCGMNLVERIRVAVESGEGNLYRTAATLAVELSGELANGNIETAVMNSNAYLKALEVVEKNTVTKLKANGPVCARYLSLKPGREQNREIWTAAFDACKREISRAYELTHTVAVNAELWTTSYVSRAVVEGSQYYPRFFCARCKDVAANNDLILSRAKALEVRSSRNMDDGYRKIIEQRRKFYAIREN